MSVLEYLHRFESVIPGIIGVLCWLVFILLLYLYGKYRKEWWRRILGASLDYHKFHLMTMQGDKNIDEKTREFSTALLWAINKQLPLDLKGGGGRALMSSLVGEKTALNTCGTIFYEASRHIRFIDVRIVRLNDTLLSTFYRIFFLESFFFPLAVFFMDIFFFISLIRNPGRGASRLYIEMKKDISCE